MTDVTTLPPAPPGGPSSLLTARAERVLVSARLGALFRICYVNLILTIVTVGIYRFWAKTRLRRYFWRHVSVGGESFEYTGTGKELLKGFLKAVLVLFLPLALTGIAELLLDSPWDAIVSTLKFVAIAIVFAAGTYAARRYRMSRTTWSGIRFHQAGSPWRYAWLYIRGTVLSALTLGLYVPWFRTGITAYETENLHLGTEPFRFAGRGRVLFKRWLVVWVLMVVLVALAVGAYLASALVMPLLTSAGLEPAAQTAAIALANVVAVAIVGLLALPIAVPVLLWYRAAELRYFAAQTSIGGITIAMTVRGRNLFMFYLVNTLILGVSFGILFPIVVRRRVTFWARWLTFDGAMDLGAIRQTAHGPRTGEGLANFFDMDFLGV